MKVEVIKAFRGVPDGEFQPRTIKVGSVISGDLARVALEEGWAKALGAPENKALGGAPENKFLGSSPVAGIVNRARGKRAKSDKGGR